MARFGGRYRLFFNFSIILFNLSLLPGCAAVMDFEKDIVWGKHFIIGTVEIPPYIIIKRDNNGTLLQVDGFVHQIVQFLANKFKFTPQMALLVLVSTIPATEIDMIATGLAVTLSRFHVIDYTFPFESDPITLLIPYPKKDSTLNSILKPFSTEVWILLAISMAIYAYLMSWAGYLRARWFNRSYQGTTDNLDSRREIARQPGKFADNIMFLLSVLVNRKFPSKYQKRSFYFPFFTVIAGNVVPPGFGEGFRILVAVWCLIAVVISNSYNTSIKSFLTLPKYRPVIRSLRDLTENSEYSFAAKKHSSVWSNMIEAQSGPFAKIGDVLRKHPENSLDMLDDNIDFVIYHKKVLAQQSGMLAYWKNTYWPRTNRCSAPISTKPASNTERLTLNYLSGAFLLLCAGMMVSLFSFAAELIRNYCLINRSSMSK
ncbi:hypothetical protein GHT06_016465 [Daphnia sinensis]|uniref:Ionotropic glutamate receptor C-terminal domain-containing protein n=1 Tax=Daphnia sinensis TaxID=1820382 RepID=A0AAD5L5Q3_9CRUS|nr:hypothetical protein GHT06_016465 [Daphnia sinensis]